MKKLYLLFIIALFLSVVITYAVNETTLYPSLDSFTICEPNPLTISGSDIHITEVGFDGNDEWVEITNIGNETFSGIITLSGVKSSILSYNVQLSSMNSIVVGDTLSSITGIVTSITGQGFSIPDTTGFTISLLVNDILTHQYSFSKSTIIQIPNTIGLEAIWSGHDFIWVQTSSGTTINTLSPLIGNPGILFCSPTTYQSVLDNNGLIEDTGNILSGDTISENTGTILDDLSGMQYLDISGDNNLLVTIQTGGELQSNLIGNSFIPQALPCIISEIHATADIYPEYVELLCEKPFSGSLKTIGIGVGGTTKDITISSNGGYSLIASSVSGFYGPYNVYKMAGISLRDSGETISLFLSGYITGDVVFPSIPEGKSFYPLCGMTGCIGLPSPGFSELYISGYVIGPIEQQISPVLATTTSSQSTYYQDLYNKRKNTAEVYKSENATLKKEQTRLNKEIATYKKATPLVKPQSTSSNKGKKAIISPTTTQSKQSKSSKTPTKSSTTKKTTTISTTSKAYTKLVDEHKVYKNYISFVDSYLKSHLYTQYSTLGIAKLQTLLTTSLKAISKQTYIIPISGSTTGISVFDFEHQILSKSRNFDSIYLSFYSNIMNVVSLLSNDIPIFLAKHISKDTLIEGQNPSKNDTGNDIMGIKISETSYLHYE